MPGSKRGFAAVLVFAAAFWATGVSAQPGAASESLGLETEGGRQAVLDDLSSALDSDFDSAIDEALSLLERPELPAAFRVAVLRAALAAAGRASPTPFDERVEQIHADLLGELDSPADRSHLHQALGNLRFYRGRHADAEASYQRAIDELGERDPIDEASIRSSMGAVLAQQGRLDDALEVMLEAYRLHDRLEVPPNVTLLRNIGAVANYLEDWPRAIEFSQRAIDAIGPDAPEAAGIYSNLAVAHIERNEWDQAQAALQKGVELGERSGRPNGSVVSNLAYVYREQGELDLALQEFQRARDLFASSGDTGSVAIAWKNIGETQIARGRREDAAVALDRSLSLYRDTDIKPKRIELYPVMVENLEALGRFREALERMGEWRALSEELSSAETQTRIVELQNAFDLERRERELVESERLRLEREAELAILQAEQAREDLIRWGLMCGVALLGLFLLVVVRNLRLRTRANRLLAEKNAEIDVQREALARANSLLHRLSNADDLTGLDNRRGLRRRIAPERPGPLQQAPSLVVLIDLDRFKQINDRFGHAAGDRVLSRFADVLRDVAGPGDVLARWGGEEFLWLVAGAEAGALAEICDRLLERVRAARFEIEDRSIAVTCSLGCAPMDLRGDAPEDEFAIALRLADAALYEAKQRGRDRWTAFDRRVENATAFGGTLDTDRLLERGDLVMLER